jgi:hypothetical protein
MKKYIFLSIFCLFNYIFINSQTITNTPIVFKGCISLEDQFAKVPQVRIYYSGKQTMSDTEGFYSFQALDNQVNKYVFIITKTIKLNFQKGNTVDNLSIIPDKRYICYKFKRVGSEGSWVQKEKKLDKKNFVIPTNAIIVLIDPKYIKSVENWTINLPGHFVKLPKITLQSGITQEKLGHVSAKSLLASLDSTMFHEHTFGRAVPHDIEQNTQVQVKISLPE